MKTILLPLFLLALNLSYASPVDSNIGSREDIFGCDEEEPLNTDYLRTTSTGATSQKTGVMVGTGTDFTAGARLVMDVTFAEEANYSYVVFAWCSGYGYMWQRLSRADTDMGGRHIVEWINQSNIQAYFPLIDGFPASYKVQTWWQISTGYELLIGSHSINSDCSRFHGLYHSIKIYDIYGELRHHWVPDPSNRFFDLITETYTTRGKGVWTYGDLAE